MSLKVMTWAWSVCLPPAPKLLLMALADEANDAGYCFPSHRHLSDKCNVSERTVRRMLGLLIDADLVSIEHRFRSNRARTSNGYRLTLDPPVKLAGGPRSDCPGAPVSSVRGDRTTVSGGPGHSCDLLTTTEPCIYPKTVQGRAEREDDVALRTGPDSAAGAELIFPKQLSEPQRQTLRKELAAVLAVDAQQILDELAGRLASTRLSDPVRYCVALISRLKRGRFTPELGIQIAADRAAELAAGEARRRASNVAIAGAHAGNVALETLPEGMRLSLERLRQSVQSLQSKAVWRAEEIEPKEQPP